MPNPLVHFEVAGRDGAAIQQVYRDAFDWDVNANNPLAYGLVEAQDEGIGVGVGGAMEGAGSPA